MQKREEIIKTITECYLSSWDFNGMPIRTICDDFKLNKDDAKKILRKLIQDNKVTLVFGDIHPSPYIKAFKEEGEDEQINKLMKSGLEHVCVYPTPAHLKKIVDKADYSDRPFTLKLAMGEPQLSFYSFDLSVLDFYHNDPRYTYWSNVTRMFSHNN
jgi:hypothetical protein